MGNVFSKKQDNGFPEKQDKVLLTLGYGRTKKDAFIKRVIELQQEYGELTILDVRARPGSRNGRWCYAGEPMQETLATLGAGYEWLDYLGNTFGGTMLGLRQYREWLIGHDQHQQRMKFNLALKNVYGSRRTAVLLCAERKPFTDVGLAKANCHRVALADYASTWSAVLRVIHCA